MTDDGPEKREEPTEEELAARLKRLLGEHSEDLTEEEALEAKKLRAIEDELAAVSEHRHDRESEIHADFEERLKALEEKAERHRVAREAEKKQTQARRDVENQDSRSLGLGLSVAYAIVGLPLMGAGIGYLVDKGTDSNVWMGFGALIGATIGLIHAITMLNKHNK